MSEPLTRERLYELVWSRPRTTLATDMGVSDVWIGKQCRAMNVPMPPRGYWASLAAGGKAKAKYVKPPLTYTLAERIQADHDGALEGLRGFEDGNFQQPVPVMPSLAESLEQAVARYMSLAGMLPSRQRGNLRHPIVQRLLAEDERRAAEATSYSWRQPVYRGADGPYLLRLIDEVAWHWTDCGFGVSASRAHDVELHVSCDGLHCRFEVLAAPAAKDEPRRSRTAGSATFEFWLHREVDRGGGRGKEAPILVFEKGDKSVVRTVTSLLLSRWERRFREWLKWRYEEAGHDRQRAIRAAEEAARRDRERREAEARALLLKRQRLLLRATHGVRRSDEIRQLVQSIEGSTEGQGVKAELLSAWRTWMLSEADAMDLRVRSAAEIEKWMGDFGFGEATSSTS